MRCTLGTVDAVHGQHAVLDLERGQRDVGGQVGRVAQHLAERLPVPAALVVEGQAQHRPLELDLVGFHGAPEQGGTDSFTVMLSVRKNGSSRLTDASAMRTFSKRK
jgi:hypothetical protein